MGAALVISIAAAMAGAPGVSAACGYVRTASTYNSGTGGYVYWSLVDGDPASGTLAGNVWQAGSPVAYNPLTGLVTCTESNGLGFLYFGSTGIGLNLHMESCGLGCPNQNSTLAVLAQHATNITGGGNVGFLLATAAETPAHVINFDYSTEPYQLVRLPKPVVTSICDQCPAGFDTLELMVPSVAAGLYGPNAAATVTGYRILYSLATSNPGNDASAYSLAATISAPGGVAAQSSPFTVSCPSTGARHGWIATQLSFENGEILSPLVSTPQRIFCGSRLADPRNRAVPGRPVGAAQTSD